MLRPHIERMRRLASISVAEVSDHDSWQRAGLGVAVAAADHASLGSVLDRLRRYLDQQFDIELVDMAITYLEEP